MMIERIGLVFFENCGMSINKSIKNEMIIERMLKYMNLRKTIIERIEFVFFKNYGMNIRDRNIHHWIVIVGSYYKYYECSL